MIKNYFKIAWRNALRNKTQSFINVFGLALGVTCYLLISLWVEDEKAKDNFHQNGAQLYTVYLSTTADGKTEGTYASPYKAVDHRVSMLLEDVKEAIPEIENLSFYATGYELPWGHPETFQVGEKKVKLSGSRASKDFFRLFSYPLIEGNSKTALREMSGIAISRKMAEIFFGSPKNAMGKSIRYENQRDFVINAVFENVSNNSSLQFDFLFNWESQTRLLEWASTNVFTYIQLARNTDIKQVQAKLEHFLIARLEPKDGVEYHIGLQNFKDQYLYNHFINGKPTNGRIEYVSIFNGVAIFILLIACINFMNLATARSVKRAKEVGLRKVIGSNRSHLIGQFFGESLLYSLAAACLTLLFILVSLHAFNLLTGKHLDLPFLQLSFWGKLVSVSFITGIVSGSYPALYLSSLRPVQILKGIMQSKKGTIFFRKASTTFQFVLSSLLIMATLVIARQMNYVQHSDLGYNRENLVYIRIEGDLSKYEKYKLFKEEAAQSPGIELVDRSTEAPHEMAFEVSDPIKWQGKTPNVAVPFKPASVGFDFVKLMKLNLVAGRDFSNTIATDSADAFLVNEEAIKQMGLKDPIGKWVSAWDKKGHIIGILRDFHTQSLRDPIRPIILDVKEYEYFGFIIVRTKAGQTREALNGLAKLYEEINPNYPFVYQFVDQEYENLYKNELTITKLSITFSILSIIISCLGLLGLVIFSVEQRVKEIGIRKVLGAGVGEIVQLLSVDFIKLICLALMLAIPIGYLLMEKWLASFAYRISLQWWVFALTGGLILLLAQLTISFQAIKAALANPVSSIHEE